MKAEPTVGPDRPPQTESGRSLTQAGWRRRPTPALRGSQRRLTAARRSAVIRSMRAREWPRTTGPHGSAGSLRPISDIPGLEFVAPKRPVRPNEHTRWRSIVGGRHRSAAVNAATWPPRNACKPRSWARGRRIWWQSLGPARHLAPTSHNERPRTWPLVQGKTQ